MRVHVCVCVCMCVCVRQREVEITSSTPFTIGPNHNIKCKSKVTAATHFGVMDESSSLTVRR